MARKCECGRSMRSNFEKCWECRRLESKKSYTTPNAPLTDEEKLSLNKLKRIYDPRIGIEEYFQEAYNSIS